MAFDFADEPVPEFDPAWRTAAVVGLAKAIADGRSDVFPILADALADAGCNDPRILDHCRDCESHREDCWVLASIERTDAPDTDDSVPEWICPEMPEQTFAQEPVTVGSVLWKTFQIAVIFCLAYGWFVHYVWKNGAR